MVLCPLARIHCESASRMPHLARSPTRRLAIQICHCLAWEFISSKSAKPRRHGGKGVTRVWVADAQPGVRLETPVAGGGGNTGGRAERHTEKTVDQ